MNTVRISDAASSALKPLGTNKGGSVSTDDVTYRADSGPVPRHGDVMSLLLKVINLEVDYYAPKNELVCTFIKVLAKKNISLQNLLNSG